MRIRLTAVRLVAGVTLAGLGTTAPIATAQPQIVGGTLASAGEYPYMAALVDPLLGQFCGGTLVKASYIVTAAHCTAFIVPGVTRALLGTTTVNNGGSVHTVAAVVVHPQYNALTSHYDVAVLRLLNSSTATPLPYASPSQIALWAPGTQATIIGWGTTREGGDPSNELREATVPVVSDTDCIGAYDSINVSPALNLCAGNLANGGVDTCQGDSGGPLMVKNGTAFLLAGITSWGEGCAKKGKPGVYTEVAAMKTFIDLAVTA